MTLPENATIAPGALIDFHCHVDLYPDYAALASECERLCIYTLAVTTTPRAWPRERDLFGGMRFLRPALGLHPELVAERGDEIQLWERHLDETRYIGEVGLDGRPRHRASLAAQRIVFQRVLEACAEHGRKVLTVHSPGATEVAVRMIVDYLPSDRGRAVLHWFTGTKSEMFAAAAHGCYFSINSTMLQSKTGRSLVAAIPADRLLTETDGPFTKVAGRPARPADVAVTVAALAELLGLNAGAMSNRLRANLVTLLA